MSYPPPGGAPPPPTPQGWQPPGTGAPFPASGYATQGYGYGPSTARPMSLKGLSTALLVLLSITGVVSIVAAVTLFNRATVVDDFTNGDASLSDINDADSAVGGAVGFFIMLAIATGVVWIIWQFRHAKNAQTLRGNYGLAPGWAIGGWFIPAGNYVLPQLQLFQAAKASDPDLPPGQPAASGRAPGAIVPWWILLDVASALFWIGRVTRPGDDELDGFVSVARIRQLADDFATADRLSAISCLLLAVAAVLAILVVRSVTERQTTALATLAPQSYPQQGWPQQPAPPQQQWAQPQQQWPQAPPQQWQPPPAPAPPPPAPPQQWQPPPPPPPPPG